MRYELSHTEWGIIRCYLPNRAAYPASMIGASSMASSKRRPVPRPYQRPVAALKDGRASRPVATSQMPSETGVLSRRPRMRS